MAARAGQLTVRPGGTAMVLETFPAATPEDRERERRDLERRLADVVEHDVDVRRLAARIEELRAQAERPSAGPPARSR